MLLHENTPIIYSEKLFQKTGIDCFFKVDRLQPCGSFKIRGIGLLCQHYLSQGYKQFVCSSGGNAGIAVAYAGMKLNCGVKVFIPKSSNQIYVDKIKQYGADVQIVGDYWEQANDVALEWVANHEKEYAYIPPFDHSVLWEGHASVIDESAQEITKPDAVIASVGGGGLACGILEGMYQNQWHDVPLLCVETIGADSFYQSVQAKKVVTLENITSKATTLGAKTVCERLIAWQKQHEIMAYRVSDDDAAQGSYEFAKEFGVMTELSAGASLSIPYLHSQHLESYQRVLIIVCGGINTEFLFNMS